MPSLDELVSQKVILCPKSKFQPNDSCSLYLVTLRAVEAGGVWIEHSTLTQIVAQAVGKKPNELPRDPVFFLPYSEISHIVTFSVRIDEETLGLAS